MDLRPYQIEAKNAILETWNSGIQKTLLVLPTGTGKCFARGTHILMSDFSVKNVEDICAGEKVSGWDGQPRVVCNLAHGKEEMFKVTPKHGESYTVNRSHILCLKMTKNKGENITDSLGRKFKSGDICNISVDDFLKCSKTFKHCAKMWHASLSFADSDVPMNSYILGYWLGDGISRSTEFVTEDFEVIEEFSSFCSKNFLELKKTNHQNSGKATQYTIVSSERGWGKNILRKTLREYNLFNNKHIPDCYKFNSRKIRLELLAGLIDSDGSLNCGCFEFCTISKKLKDDFCFLCRSLGYMASVTYRTNVNAYRVMVSGNIHEIPTRISRKKAHLREQKKNVLMSGFSVESIGEGEYFGFELLGKDRMFLLEDLTVVHNTIVFSKVIEERVRQGGNVLVLAHREELLNQAADKLEKSTGLGTALEKAESSCLDSWFNVTVGSVQTLQNEKRLQRFNPDYFDTVIVDEAHHAVSASYRRVLDYFKGAKILGVTATADRGDKRNLGELFETIAYEYTLVKAIRDGYLCPIKALTLPLNIDLVGVKQQSGDFQAAALGSALDPYLEQIAVLMLEQCRTRKTVVFLPLVSTSQKFCAILNRAGLSAVEVNGESKDRAEVLRNFHEGKYQVLCNSMLLTEGWDEPQVDCIVCLRPTKVRALYAQIVGRGTRIHQGKSDLLLLDFLWQTEQHDLCRPAHLICENTDISARVAEIMAEETQGAAVDLFEMELSAESQAQQEREESLRKILEEQKKRKRALVDPLQYEMSIAPDGKCREYEPDPMDLRAQVPPSAAQLSALEKAGVFPDEVKCAGQASAILETITKRRMEGLTTPKQIRFLERMGFAQVGTWPFESAKKMIDRIAANRWCLPHGINPKTYDYKGA